MNRQLSTDWSVNDLVSAEGEANLTEILDEAWSDQVTSLGLQWSSLTRSAHAILRQAHATPGFEAVPAKWRRQVMLLHDIDVSVGSIIAGSSGLLGSVEAYDDLLAVVAILKRVTPADLQKQVVVTSLVRPGFDFTAAGVRSRSRAVPSFHAIGHAVDLQGLDATASRRIYDVIRSDQQLQQMAHHVYYDIGKDGRGAVHSRRPIVHYDFKPSEAYVKKLADQSI